MKTDNPDLFGFTLENLDASPFKMIDKNDNYLDHVDFDTMTE